MNKTKIIGSVLVLVVIVGLIFFTGGAGSQQTSGLDVIDTASGFYDQWLAASKDATVEPSLDELAESPILSKALRTKIAEARETTGTSTDPVLCQTKTPEAISIRRVFEDTEKAEVLVTSRDKKVTDQALVTLMGLDGSWYIDNIECSLGEFEPEREFTFEKEGFLLKGSIPAPFNKNNWHLVFEENGQTGNVVPLFFDTTSECTSLKGEKALCNVAQFTEASKASIQGQMTERGVTVKFLKLVK